MYALVREIQTSMHTGLNTAKHFLPAAVEPQTLFYESRRYAFTEAPDPVPPNHPANACTLLVPLAAIFRHSPPLSPPPRRSDTLLSTLQPAPKFLRIQRALVELPLINYRLA